jgi:hypothetical protein
MPDHDSGFYFLGRDWTVINNLVQTFMFFCLFEITRQSVLRTRPCKEKGEEKRSDDFVQENSSTCQACLEVAASCPRQRHSGSQACIAHRGIELPAL